MSKTLLKTLAKERTEESLIKGCVNGDNACLELLYKTYIKRMRGLVYRYARTTSDLDDIVQEGFIKIFQHIKSYSYAGSFEGWMKRIIINTAINYYKKNLKLRMEVNLEDYHTDESKGVEIADNLSVEELQKLIARLPEGYRFILNLYAIDGYSHKEIAEMLQISESTSSSQFHRAKKTLLKLIEKENKEMQDFFVE